ncbi:hypothetical protein E1B28_007730 [Marasmius oreades]|uniref:Uncharacterized protein n=1 Tax=Marasmius oreades TaxID=181124 RepID=A0A9P7S2Y6_9AGAR|nr:uncharacterized protein E1B28_007730 [Marasmius oreades]KAG7094117.1 hypothetical protein E1B28_007730 [Marasmius oreades]
MHARVSATQQEARVNALQQEADRLQQELGIGEDAAKIVDNHIKLLHRYNEIKDATQVGVYTTWRLKYIDHSLELIWWYRC